MSKKFEQVKYFYNSGVWNELQVKSAVVKNWITAEEYKEITGKEYSD